MNGSPNAAPSVLVTAGSKHGATHEIGDAIARALQQAGVSAVSVPVERDPDPGGADAVVLGSAVYAGRWRDEARH